MTELTEREIEICEHIREPLDRRYRSVTITLVSALAILVVGGGIFAWQLIEANNRSEQRDKVVNANTSRIVAVEDVIGALQGLNRHETRKLFNKLLRNRTKLQKRQTSGRRKTVKKTVFVPGRAVVISKPARRAPSRPALKPPRPLSMGEKIHQDTCAQIHRAMPQAVC